MKKGFTLVELVIVVAVIGILAAIVAFSYGSVQENIAKSQMTTDLNGVKAAMDTARYSSSAGYPTTIPTKFKRTEGVTLTYVRGDSTSYCIEAQSSRKVGFKYYLDSSDSTSPKAGACPAAVVIPGVPTITAANITGGQAYIAWVSGAAASYNLQYRQNGGTWSAVSSTAKNRTIAITQGSRYEFRVQAVSSASTTSNWSTIVERKSAPAPAISSAVDLGCGVGDGNTFYAQRSVRFTITAHTHATSYIMKRGEGLTDIEVPNTVGAGPFQMTGETSRWPANLSGYGTITLQAKGAMGELSTVTVWTSSTYPPYEC